MTLTLAAAGNTQVMVDLLLILAAAATVSLICRRLKIAAIAGYLIAGAIFGPNAVGLIGDSESIASISQIAIILLMFGIGLNLDPNDLRRGLLPTLLIGFVSTFVVIASGTPIAALFGLGIPAAIAVAGAVANSSTAVVLRTLQQRRMLRRVHGQIAFGTLLAQDMVVIVVIAMIPVLGGLAGTDAGAAPFDLVAMLGKSALVIGAISLLVVFGRTLLPKLVAEAAREAGSELLLVLAAAIGLGAAVLTTALDLSPALGAFLAGFLLAGTPVRFQLAGQIGPMRDLFMAVFFTAVGLTLNIGEAFELWWVVLLALLAVVTIKSVVIAATAWVFGASPSMAAIAGINLCQSSEFTLVILGVAAASGLFAEQTATVETVLIAVVFLSLFITPGIMTHSERIGRRLGDWPQAPWFKAAALGRTQQDDAGDQAYRVVIAGFGPVGRALVERFLAKGVQVSVIELNRKTVERQTGLGRHIVYGDATNPDVLESAGVSVADAVVLTIPDDDAMLRACKVIRTMNRTAFIAARTNYLSKAFLAKELGANHVTVEEIATAEAMAEQVLACFDLSQLPPGGVHAAEPVSPASS